MPKSAMAAISRLVAMGRRMKISERFTTTPQYGGRVFRPGAGRWAASKDAAYVRRRSRDKASLLAPILTTTVAAASAGSAFAAAWPATRASSLSCSGSSSGGIRVRARHARTVLEPELAFGDNGLAGLQPLFNHDLLVHPPPHGHRPLFDSGIFRDDEDELPVLTDLDRLLRHDRRIRQGRQAQAHASELTGPEVVIGVGVRALQLDGV